MQVVRGNHHADPTLGQSGQDAREAACGGGVKSVVGLIEQQDVRAPKHGGGQREALPHPLAQAVHRKVRLFLKPDQANCPFDQVQTSTVHHRQFLEHRVGRALALPAHLFRHVADQLSK